MEREEKTRLVERGRRIKWTGEDVPDFKKDKSPDYRPAGNENGLDAQPGDAPFILHEDGLGWLYIPKGLQDGPMPTHYEAARVAGQ